MKPAMRILAGIPLLVLSLMHVSAATKSSELRTGVIIGSVMDEQTLEGLGWASVLLVELNRFVTAHEDGSFQFLNVPAGKHTLKVMRLGYHSTSRIITVPQNDTLRLVVKLANALLFTPSVTIEEHRHENAQAVVSLSGKKLQLQLGRTLAETMSGEAGVTQRTMGPAPARPVLRGMSGDHLLILENGERTGDLSATSSDHAVSIEPMNAERIEIIRGPAALQYGSNPIGGVVNVERNQILSTLPDHIHGTASVHGESVNEGIAGGVVVYGPIEPFTFRFDLSGRKAADIATPIGSLRNTAIETWTAAGGASYIEPWGIIGLSGSALSNSYGIPGGFVGAHPNGVSITMERRQFDARTEFFPQNGVVRRLEAEFSATRYNHEEVEDRGIIGARYGVVTMTFSSNLHHNAIGMFQQGLFGVWSEYRDFAAGGFVMTPATKQWSIAAFGVENWAFDRLVMQAAFRVDLQSVNPQVTGVSSIGTVRTRSFTNVSGGVMAQRSWSENFQSTVTLMRTHRAPGTEELFSEGPHLAAYSFEVGNPDLTGETAWGVECATQFRDDAMRARGAVFFNSFQNYIYPRNTGKLNFRTLLPIYQFSGASAQLFGGEIEAEYALTDFLQMQAVLSYTHGVLTESEKPLPFIPPLFSRLSLTFSKSALSAGIICRVASAQRRTGEFEEATAGYAVFDSFFQVQFGTSNLFHTATLTLENAFDAQYRSHLSRVKSIMPEPGRNVKLLYRIFF